MKIRISVKDCNIPDSIKEAIREEANGDEDAIDVAMQEYSDNGAKKHFEYGEYIELEIDTTAGTVEVAK